MKSSKAAVENRLTDKWLGKFNRLKSRLAFLAKSKTARNELRMAIIFLGLIILPSGLLGYFSWRAIENEKFLSQRRLQESYRQFARLAAREIDNELEEVEKRWIAAVEEVLAKGERSFGVEDLERLAKKEPLIAACFWLVAPGKVVYPSGLSLREESASPQQWETESYVREHKIFSELARRGEELEYRSYDLNGAMAAYREILAKVSNPHLRAMAESHLGRTLQKDGDWSAALSAFQNLLARYPEARDLNNMYLRFVAQYQIAVCLENLGRDQEAVEALLRLHQDLLERSDAINAVQYSFFVEKIKNLAPRLLASPHLPDPAGYQAQFRTLAEQNKKRISQKYFLQLLNKKLNERVIKRKRHNAKFRYISDDADNEPFLLAYRSLPDPSDLYIAGLLALEIDLARLRDLLFPAILRNLKLDGQVTLAILNDKGEYIIGTGRPVNQLIARQTLAEPFDFWQVAVYLNDLQVPPPGRDFRTTLWLWLISLLLFSILLGAYLFIRRARREAHLSQLKSTFVSNVSHELRTPLASIKMLAELLEMQEAGRPAAPSGAFKSHTLQYSGIIRRECDRLGRLIENVLDFSKIERGDKQYNFEYEDPAAVLRMAVESFRPHAEAQGFTLQVEIAETLPELRLDADAMIQVILNLLSNAVKYSDAAREIRVRAFRDGAQVKFEVSDRGLGIAAAEIPKIFEAFYRVDQRLNARTQGGMGLGLTLARHIIRAHEGDITVRSEEGKGSTFTIALPIPTEELPYGEAKLPANGKAWNPARDRQQLETGTNVQ